MIAVTASEILDLLPALGKESQKRVLLKHGAVEPFFGVPIGAVAVDVGETDCKIPLASADIAKIEAMGRTGTKRKTAMC